MYIALNDTKSIVYHRQYPQQKSKIMSNYKISELYAVLAVNDGDGLDFSFSFFFFFLANFHIDFFFFISVLCCTEVAISLDFSININFFMKPTIVIGYGELCLIQCFA